VIVVATGHVAIRDYVQRTHDPKMIWVDDWQKIATPELTISQLFLAQDVRGFEQALKWLQHMIARGWKTPVVIWVRDEYAHPLLDQLADRVTIWRGEIGQDTLQAWCAARAGTTGAVSLARHWGVITAYPYPPLSPLIATLSDYADRSWGLRGGWIDAEWFRAELSCLLAPELYVRDMWIERSLPYVTARGYLIPAPPGWRPGVSGPGRERVLSWFQLPWAWQGWFFGTQYATSLALTALDRLAHMVLWIDDVTPPSLIQHVRDFVETYRPDIEWTILSPSRIDPSVGHAWRPPGEKRATFPGLKRLPLSIFRGKGRGS
jgi:hypothetical protein